MDPANNVSGRYTNKGAEGLALSPDGKTLVVAMQNALIQDGGPKGLTLPLPRIRSIGPGEGAPSASLRSGLD